MQRCRGTGLDEVQSGAAPWDPGQRNSSMFDVVRRRGDWEGGFVVQLEGPEFVLSELTHPVAPVCSPGAGGGDRRIPVDGWPADLVETVSSRLRERLSLKKGVACRVWACYCTSSIAWEAEPGGSL